MKHFQWVLRISRRIWRSKKFVLRTWDKKVALPELVVGMVEIEVAAAVKPKQHRNLNRTVRPLCSDHHRPDIP
jgi:hypothetical protein